MYHAASRRVCAQATKLLRAQRQPLTRSIQTHSARPTPCSKSPRRTLNYISSLHTRHLTTAQKIRMKYREASKGVFRKNPILLPLAIFSVVGGIAVFAYVSYVEVTRVQPQYHKFPPPVTEKLRTAVYYTEISLNPPKALSAYKEALKIGLEMGMHPFSDEILGIKLQVAMMLEKSGLVKPAVEVLERTKMEALKWIEEGRKSEIAASDTKTLEKEALKALNAPPNVPINDQELQTTLQQMRETQEFETRQRDRALKKVIGIEMKLAELYASDYMQDEKKAEEAQVAAVELSLKELNRRQKLGLPIGGGTSDDGNSESWLSMTEIATALSELADTYIAKDRAELAMPLYLRALDLIRTAEGNAPSCKQVVLLNSVASAMVGQAIDVAAYIMPPVRDEECDITCVAATYNLGEIAELQKRPEVALQRYREAKSLAQGLGYEDGIAMADEALKRLKI
ncbi:hypothetical protein N7539_006264 [Penicillium diatomitis]|uniref:TPR domain protein n=1 Tax=Penicillium diatomitis TaxID=2819901 RepID=A0A9W9X335_9EURO|nr:uncharacterized protein N7539_006264 [Penicillium diatomitis]KAJ5482818.1 hypothetical protein N7539_006264 [Penicillium diatomitis]